MNDLLPLALDEPFELTEGQASVPLELELSPAELNSPPLQAELYLPVAPSTEAPNPQIEFDGMSAPRYQVAMVEGATIQFQHAHTLLEALENQGVNIHYQCREGYCGSCRVQLLEGAVHYLNEPMAWLNAGEILTCCSVPKSHLKIKLRS